MVKLFTISHHSIIDVITNSSTEIFSCASTNSRESIIKLIDSILEFGGSELRSSDLFKHVLVIRRNSMNYPHAFKEDILKDVAHGRYNPAEDDYKYISLEAIGEIMACTYLYDSFYDELYKRGLVADIQTIIYARPELFKDADIDDEIGTELLFIPKSDLSADICTQLDNIINLFPAMEVYN